VATNAAGHFTARYARYMGTKWSLQNQVKSDGQRAEVLSLTGIASGCLQNDTRDRLSGLQCFKNLLAFDFWWVLA